MRKSGALRPSFSALSSVFALSVCALAACNFLNNDWKSHHPDAVSPYDTSQTAGFSAHSLLSDASFKSLTVELQAVQGFEPSMDAVNSLRAFLVKHLNKPAGITLIEDDPIPSPGGSGSYGITDVRAIEARHRQLFPQKDQMTVYVLFLDGKSSDDQGSTQVLGQAHLNSSIVIYANSLRQAAASGGNTIPLSTLEATVMRHEFGHLLGLVNLGTTSQADHEDPHHSMHCKNSGCLMYFAADTTALLGAFQGTDVPDLDDDCQKDLKSNGGK